jgi:hypothetical protein
MPLRPPVDDDRGDGGGGGQGGKQKLKDKDTHENAREEALEFSRDCNTFLGNALKKMGVTMDDLAKAIKSQQPYDATASTIKAVDAGILPAGYSNPKIPNAASLSVRDFFAKAKEIGEEAGAATGFFKNATRNDVYFNPGDINSRSIIHEALHSFTGLNDRDLAEKLGRTDGERLVGSAWINDRLFKWGCGSE